MIRIVDKTLVITKKVKPKKGDWMCCHAIGIPNTFNKRGGKRIGEKRYLSFHDDTPKAKLNAICKGTEKVIFKISCNTSK
jgi:hypothetical protein